MYVLCSYVAGGENINFCSCVDKHTGIGKMCGILDLHVCGYSGCCIVCSRTSHVIQEISNHTQNVTLTWPDDLMHNLLLQWRVNNYFWLAKRCMVSHRRARVIRTVLLMLNLNNTDGFAKT